MDDLPAAEYADTEVSTNFPFAVSFGRMNRLEVVLSLMAMPTNNVEVAIGTDADGDGELRPEESAWVFGWDCGRWFTREADTDEVKVEGGGEGRCELVFVLKKSHLNEAWNLVKVTRRGFGPDGEWATIRGRMVGLMIFVL